MWFEYCKQAYEYPKEVGNLVHLHRQQHHAAQQEITRLNQEIAQIKEELVRTKDELSKKNGAFEYQEGKLVQAQKDLLEYARKLESAHQERDRALTIAIPTVNTPRTSPTPEASTEVPPAPVLGTSPSSDSHTTRSSFLSERLPDPRTFSGDRKDLRRFTSQIQEKLNINLDRFPTPASRMSYVTSRLEGIPYAQILPYIQNGRCVLSDYQKILDILENAFGDPNRTSNARDELFRFRQSNKEFGQFFAEFQRLALEGEMPEETLPTLLEQAINRELRGMLLHNEPPTREYHQFAAFLQKLENRRMHYDRTTRSPVVRPLPTQIQASNPAPTQYTRPDFRTARNSSPTPRPAFTPDPMDLTTNRLTRRDRGECFRCGAKGHLVRDCPYPDQRPTRAHAAYLEGPTSPRSQPITLPDRQHTASPERRARSPPSRRSSYDESSKGVSLV
ncbi:hypothetical protein N7486_005619 [Penicillium sp. IBT 16267x]|nr:hypothetical protein N7486_005619 [Penicillium sp. IBT 16267x]